MEAAQHRRRARWNIQEREETEKLEESEPSHRF